MFVKDFSKITNVEVHFTIFSTLQCDCVKFGLWNTTKIIY